LYGIHCSGPGEIGQDWGWVMVYEKSDVADSVGQFGKGFEDIFEDILENNL
jgi:hypothetical protein